MASDAAAPNFSNAILSEKTVAYPTQPSPPYKRGQQHSVGLGSINYTHTKFLTATIRLFGDSGAGDKGMPFYTVIYGSGGRHRVVAKPRSPRLSKTILL